MGVDGWWPDEGDPLDIASRLVRNRMYWEGPQLFAPNVRPFALHRNGYAGMQRYAWLWSGDTLSTWKTLKTQIPIAINTGLSGSRIGDRHRRFMPHRSSPRSCTWLVSVWRFCTLFAGAPGNFDSVGLEHGRPASGDQNYDGASFPVAVSCNPDVERICEDIWNSVTVAALPL
jgi:hypothetical protein